MIDMTQSNFRTLAKLIACLALLATPALGQTVTLFQTPVTGGAGGCYVRFRVGVGEGTQPIHFRVVYTSTTGAGEPPPPDEGVPATTSNMGWYEVETAKLRVTGFNGEMRVEARFTANGQYISSNTLAVNTVGCVGSPGNAGTRMAAIDDPPEMLLPKALTVKLLATLESRAEKNSDEKKVNVKLCPAKATLTGTISLREDIKEGGELYYTIEGSKELTPTQPLPPYFSVYFLPQGSKGGSQNARQAPTIPGNVAAGRSVAIPQTTWQLGGSDFAKKGPLTGYLNLVALKYKAGGGFTQGQTLATVALICAK